MFLKELSRIFKSEKETSLNKKLLILDVSSASVGGIVIETKGDEPIKILSKHRFHSNFLPDLDFEAFLRTTMGALKKVTEKIKKEPSGNINKALCVFGSPWFIAETKVVQIERDLPFEITEHFFEDVLRDETNALEEKFRVVGSGYSKFGKEVPLIIESKFLKTKLNGYRTESPVGKKASKVESEIYMSMGAKEVAEKITKHIDKVFDVDQVVFRTFPYVAFQTIHSLFNSSDGFLFIEISGETTDLILVKDESIEEYISFPKGRNTLMRKISSSFNSFPKEIHSLVKAYVAGHLDGNDQDKMIKAIEEAKMEWCTEFKKVFELIKHQTPLPQDLYLLGGDGISRKFIQCVEDDYFSAFTTLGKPFNLRSINPGSLSNFFNQTQSSLKIDDVSLIMESLYARKNL